jgi:peptidoglycan hydrolase FlgJ
MTTLPPINSPLPALGNAPATAAPDTSAASTYTDINGLAALKKDPNSPEAISAVAQQVEALFLQMMLKSMRDAAAADETASNEMGMYQDMFDKQVALSISQHADLGIGRLLKRQLAGKSAPGTVKSSSGESLRAMPAAAAPTAHGGHRALAGRVCEPRDALHSTGGYRAGSRSSRHARAGGTGDRVGPAPAARCRRLFQP